MLCGLILNPEYIKHISFGFHAKTIQPKAITYPNNYYLYIFLKRICHGDCFCNFLIDAVILGNRHHHRHHF